MPTEPMVASLWGVSLPALDIIQGPIPETPTWVARELPYATTKDRKIEAKISRLGNIHLMAASRTPAKERGLALDALRN